MPQYLFLLDQQLLQLRSRDPEEQRSALFGRDPSMPTASVRGGNNNAGEWCRRSRKACGVAAAHRRAPKRVALITEAGLGKSTNMDALESDIATAPRGRRLPFLLRLETHAQILRDDIVERRPDVLLDWMTDHVVRAAHPHSATSAERKRIRGRVVRDWADGRITLLLDGLDHVAGDEPLLLALGEMLRSPAWQSCSVVVSGRPEAFKKCWMTLIEQSPHRWRIFKIAALGKPEIDFYLGGPFDHASHARADWFDAFPPESRHLLGIPRFLGQIGGILRRGIPVPPASLDAKKEAIAALDLRTAADVYWKAYFHFDKIVAKQVGDDANNHQGLLAQGLLRHGCVAKDVPREIKRLGKVLAATAFFMLVKNAKAPDAERLFTGVPLESLKENLGKCWEDDKHGLAAGFRHDLERLGEMNNHALDFLVFGNNAGDDYLVFHDRTVQSFFAALWAVRYASKPETETMVRWRGLVDEQNNRLASFDEFWQFAAEMPAAAMAEGEGQNFGRWRKLFECCFEPSTQIRRSASRPFVSRLWSWLGYLVGKPEAFDAQSRRDPDAWLQWHRRMIYHSLRAMAERFPELVAAWRKPFADLANGKNQWIHAEVDGGFHPCPPENQAKPVRYLMGSPEGEEDRNDERLLHEVEVRPFRLHEFPVTNEQYEVFDPGHADERWDDKHLAGKHPVVNVSFWDAWRFAAWTGNRLPAEEEWELACRAGTPTAYWFGEKMDGTKCNHDRKWKGGQTNAKGDITSENPWGLWDMHGIVWEWCDSLYAPGASFRVLRGGSWCIRARFCRSANRHRDGPDVRYDYDDYGFRLAAVPVLEPSPSKVGRAEAT